MKLNNRRGNRTQNGRLIASETTSEGSWRWKQKDDNTATAILYNTTYVDDKAVHKW